MLEESNTSHVQQVLPNHSWLEIQRVLGMIMNVGKYLFSFTCVRRRRIALTLHHSHRIMCTTARKEVTLNRSLLQKQTNDSQVMIFVNLGEKDKVSYAHNVCSSYSLMQIESLDIKAHRNVSIRQTIQWDMKGLRSFLSTWLVMVSVFLFAGNEAADTDIVFHEVRKGKAVSADQYRQQLASYWTPERRRAAKPAKFPRSRLNRTMAPQQDAMKTADGPVTLIEGTLPVKNSTFSPALSVANLPTRTVGKVYFSGYDGDYECSASVVAAPSNSLLVTAGHCVFDTDYYDWYFNWWFVPGYDMGDAALGEWSANYLTTFRGWTDGVYPTYFTYDVAFVVLDRIGTRRVAQVTGSQGLGINLPRSQLTFSFGYPGDIAYGEIMSACIGTTVPAQCTFTGYTGQALRCGMGQGSSGGPWIQSFVPTTGLGKITSVNSYGCVELAPYFMHGPFFGTSVKTLYDGVKSRV